MRQMRIARYAKKAGLPPFLKENEDYGEGWTKKVDEAREEDEQDAEDGQNLIDPIDTAEYCDRPRNVKYWKEMGKGPAAKDFQMYIKEVKCSDE